MLADLRDALRQLRKAPGFALTAIITLALGIGATTAIFTLVHQVMLKSLPVVKPEELWRIGDKIRCCNWGGYVQGSDGNFALFSWEMYKHFRAHTPEFSDLAVLQAGNEPLSGRCGQLPSDEKTSYSLDLIAAVSAPPICTRSSVRPSSTDWIRNSIFERCLHGSLIIPSARSRISCPGT